MKKYMIFLGMAVGTVLSMILAELGGVVAFAENAETVVSDAAVLDVWNPPELYFKSVNPGYTVEGVSNVGEMFEIARGGNSDELISLAGVTVRYTNTSGNETVLVEFPENSFLAGEAILLRLASSPGSELANLMYKKTLAMSASLALFRGDELIDAVCFSGKDGCHASFNKNKPTTLARNVLTGEFEHLENYEPEFDVENYNEKPHRDENENAFTEENEGENEENHNEKPHEDVDEGFGEASGHCGGLQFSEILSYYAEAQSEQFVELYNAGAEQILLDGCVLQYKNKTYPLSGIVAPEEYVVLWATDFKLTKNPTTYGALAILDVDETVVDEMTYPNGQRKGTAYAMVGYDEKGDEVWHATYAVTPGQANVYQEYKTCEEGKVINEETGNCVKASAVVEKTCEAGQYLNPLTGRCKKIETEEEKVCKEGYYLYAPTGRCRKVVENDGAEYDVVPDANEKKESSFAAVYAVLGAVGVGLIYIIYEYRKEIARIFKRLTQRK